MNVSASLRLHLLLLHLAPPSLPWPAPQVSLLRDRNTVLRPTLTSASFIVIILHLVKCGPPPFPAPGYSPSKFHGGRKHDCRMVPFSLPHHWKCCSRLSMPFILPHRHLPCAFLPSEPSELQDVTCDSDTSPYFHHCHPVARTVRLCLL